MPGSGRVSRRPGTITLSTTSRDTNAAMSFLNSAPYSAEAATGSFSYAASITRCGMRGFISAVVPRQTSTSALSRP